MSFKDLFNDSFLNGYVNANIDIKTSLITLLITTVLSLFIFFVYRIITRKTFYEKNFNISLIAMAIITAAIILTIQSNIVLSLGMVGALSIVRFRTAIKEPLDLVFLYWSISVGIICGAGLAGIAVVLSLVLTLAVFAMHHYPNKKMSKLLIVNGDAKIYGDIIDRIKENTEYYKEKSKSVTNSHLELIVEIKSSDESKLVDSVSEMDMVESVTVLTHDGEITA